MRRRETAAELQQQALKYEQYSRYLASKAQQKAEAEKEEAYIHGRNRAILVFVFILVIVGSFFYLTANSSTDSENKQVSETIEMPSRVIELDKQFNYEYRSSDINYVVGHKVFLGLRHNSGDIEYIELPTKIADRGVLMARLLRVKKE